MEIACIICGSVGVVALLIGLIFLRVFHNVKRKYTGVTTGTIVDFTWNASSFNVEHGGDNTVVKAGEHFTVHAYVGGRSLTALHRPYTRMYHKVFSYSVNGMEYIRADVVRYSMDLLEKWKGKTVPVYYDEENPAKAGLSSGKGYKQVACILLPIGVLLEIAVFVMLLM